MEYKSRKSPRLAQYDYSQPGAYFITICVRQRKCILSSISVGTGVLDCPENILSKYGKIANKHLETVSSFYENIKIDKYVIMPNHIHFILNVKDYGQSRRPVPTKANSTVSSFVGTFKRLCNREYGENIWQDRFNDHVIRNAEDYTRIWNYIDTNVIRWNKDCFFSEL